MVQRYVFLCNFAIPLNKYLQNSGIALKSHPLIKKNFYAIQTFLYVAQRQK